MKYTLAVPDETMPVKDVDRNTIVEKNVVLQLMDLIVENTPQRTNAETTIAYSVKKKIEEQPGPGTMEIEKAELDFIKDGLEKLRSADRVSGSKWYHLTTALNEAKPA
jgi:hypothetical protein